jgi:hypothetical protein
MEEANIGLDYQVEEVTREGLARSLYRVGEKYDAPGFMFCPIYSIAYPRGEMVVTVLAGKSLGQRRFDYCSVVDARHMKDYAVLKTVLDTVLAEQRRIDNRGENSYGKD